MTGRVSLPGLVVADFIDSEAKQDGKAGGRTSMDETSQSDSASVIVSQSTPGFRSKCNKHRKRRHVLTDDDSSNEECGKRRERKKSPKGEGGRTGWNHSCDERVLRELQKNSSILLNLLECADKAKKRLKLVKDEISKASLSSSSDATPSRSQRKGRARIDVPSEVKSGFLFSHFEAQT